MPADGEGGSNSHTCYPYVLCSCCTLHIVPGANPFRGWPVKYVECERRGQCYGGLATTVVGVPYVTAKDKREKKGKIKGKKEMKERRERGRRGREERGERREEGREKSKSDKRTFLLEDIEIGKMGIIKIIENQKSDHSPLEARLCHKREKNSKQDRRSAVETRWRLVPLLVPATVFNPLRSLHLPAHPPNQPSACPPPQGNLGLLIIIRSKQTLGYTYSNYFRRHIIAGLCPITAGLGWKGVREGEKERAIRKK